MRIVLSGGGTGGHIAPVLAIAQQLRKTPGVELILMGEAGALSPQFAGLGVKTYHIMAGKFRRYHGQSLVSHILDFKTWLLNLKDVFKALAGLVQSLWWLVWLKPDVVFTKGGYVSLPVGLAAHWLKKPLIIHESDATPGLTNRILSRYATVIATGFPADQYKIWQGRKTVFVGNPIRTELLQADQAQAIKFFNLAADLPVVLVLGGSTGARAVTQVILKQLPELLKRYQIIHVVGKRDVELVKQRLASLPIGQLEHYHWYDFLSSELNLAYKVADCIVTRAGANFLAEIAAIGRPTIVVPNPHLTGGHQLHNAELLEKSGGAIIIQQDMLEKSLQPTLDRLLRDAKLQAELKKGLKKLAVTDGAERLAKEIVQLAK